MITMHWWEFGLLCIQLPVLGAIAGNMIHSWREQKSELHELERRSSELEAILMERAQEREAFERWESEL